MPPRKSDGPEPGQAPYFVRSNGRGRNTTGAQRKNGIGDTGRPAGNGARPTQGGAPQLPRLTGRGGVLAIVVFSFVGTMIGQWGGVQAAPGVAFTLACLLAAFLVRPGDLLSLSVSPPIAHFLALVAAETIFAVGNEGFARALVLGLASRLAEVAPWLFLGTALVLIVGVFRDLPENLRELGERLNGRG